ncbi:AAA family ATPase [Pedobacter deserti]|uniref:AAA family ATPase n=1 Tax=Pedobacter deserti TaxID=2817382 RepID=UPI00210C0187|nr:AAA family ATPase [Pedobacter sp. SYSU D00382]
MTDFNGYIQTIRLAAKDALPEGYPFNIPVIENFKELRLHPKVTYLIGDNGMGKSTLLEAIAVGLGFNAEGGTKNFNFSTQATHSNLHNYLKFTKGAHQPKDGFFLRGESFYNVASEIDRIGDGIHQWYGDKSLHEQSHGESFWALFMNRFGGNGVYILDEPESALSVTRQMALLARMNHLVNKRSQFIIATHSPIVLAYPDADIYQLTASGLEKVPYRDTDIYRLYKGFLDNPENVTRLLLEEEEETSP